MFGHDFYDEIKLGIQKLPFKSYVNPQEVSIINPEVNVIYISGPKSRMQCIVIELDGKYADFYYNGYEECFKILSDERDFIDDSWEQEDIGEPTPQILKDHGVSKSVLVKLGIVPEYV